MSIWSKVLIGFVLVLTLAFFYLATVTLALHSNWRTVVSGYETQITRYTDENRNLLEGGPQGKGIRDLKLDLDRILLDRGPAWFDVQPGPVDGNTGAVSVTIAAPAPHNVQANALLEVFAAPAEGRDATFLGEFRAAGVRDGQVDLVPALKPTAEELTRLSSAPGPWTLYETMPSDTHAAFTGATDEQLAARLPASVVDQYRKDGKPAADNDPAERVINGKYVRQLRDYGVMFRELKRQRTLLTDAIAAARLDLAYSERSLEDAKKQVEFQQQHIAQLRQELQTYERQRDAVATIRQDLVAQLEAAKKAIARLFAENQRLAEELAGMERRQTQAIQPLTTAAEPRPAAQ